MEQPLLSTALTIVESNPAARDSAIIETTSCDNEHGQEELIPSGEASSTASDESGFELGPLISAVAADTVALEFSVQDIVASPSSQDNQAPCSDPTIASLPDTVGQLLLREENQSAHNNNDDVASPQDEHSRCYAICSFLGRHGAYLLGTLFGLATALIDWSAAWQYTQYQKEVLWMNRIVFCQWSTLKLLDVTATSFYMLCGISEAVFDWNKNYYCVDFIIVTCFFWGAAFDLASSLLDQAESAAWRAQWSIHTESISVALFFSSALIQMVVNRKRYRGCRANGFAMAVFIADACFLSGTCVDWVVNGMQAQTSVTNVFTGLDDDFYNTNGDGEVWLRQTSWSIVSAIFWFLNAAISAMVEVLDENHRALQQEGDEESIDYDPPDIV